MEKLSRSKHLRINDRQQYYDFSTETGSLVDRYIDDYLKAGTVPEKREFYDPMLKRKLGSQKLRANIVSASYLFFSENKEMKIPEFVVRCSVIAEFVSWASYMVNWIYDQKSNVEDQNIRKRVAVASNAFLQDAFRLASKVRREICELFLDANDQIIKSFSAELEVLKITNQTLIGDYQKFLKFYEQHYAGPGVGAFFSACIHVGYLCADSGNEEDLKTIKDIFYEFGIHHETLNALADFVVTENPISHEKLSSDQLSDIRTNTLTPPIWLLMNSGKAIRATVLQGIGKRPERSYQQKVFLQLFRSGTYGKIVHSLKKAGRGLRKRFPNVDNNFLGAVLLKQMISVLESNKIYHYLKENYNSFLTNR